MEFYFILKIQIVEKNKDEFPNILIVLIYN